MSTYQPPSTSSKPYVEPTPLPNNLPKVNEVGATSGPLKSAAFFIGAYCKDFNGASRATVHVNHIYKKYSRGLYVVQGGEP